MKKKDKNLGEFEAICEDMSFDGKGVTHYQGKVVFVTGFFLNEKNPFTNKRVSCSSN